MSLKKVEQVKQDKGFKLFDLIIYGVILAVVAATFIAVFVTRDTSELSGIRVYAKAEVVFEYDFESVTLCKDGVTYEEDGDGIKVKVEIDGDINIFYIEKAKRTVKMTEANCHGKQCVYSHEIEDNSSIIYCSPHSLKIEPMKIDVDDPIIIM